MMKLTRTGKQPKNNSFNKGKGGKNKRSLTPPNKDDDYSDNSSSNNAPMLNIPCDTDDEARPPAKKNDSKGKRKTSITDSRETLPTFTPKDSQLSVIISEEDSDESDYTGSDTLKKGKDSSKAKKKKKKGGKDPKVKTQSGGACGGDKSCCLLF